MAFPPSRRDVSRHPGTLPLSQWVNVAQTVRPPLSLAMSLPFAPFAPFEVKRGLISTKIENIVMRPLPARPNIRVFPRCILHAQKSGDGRIMTLSGPCNVSEMASLRRAPDAFVVYHPSVEIDIVGVLDVIGICRRKSGSSRRHGTPIKTFL